MLIDDLKAVDALLYTESKWTKGYYAKDEQGEPTNSFAENAACWCLMGAIQKVTAGTVGDMVVVGNCLRKYTDMNLAVYNDRHTFAEVKDLLQKAINDLS